MAKQQQQQEAMQTVRQFVDENLIQEGIAGVVKHDWWAALELESKRGRTALGIEHVWEGVINDLAALYRLFVKLQDGEAVDDITTLYQLAHTHRNRAKAVQAGDL